VLSFVKGCVQLNFEKNSKMICYPHYLLASPRNIVVHNSILEYASTASISTVMTMPFHVKPFEKKVFEEVIFLLKYHQSPRVLKRWSIEKERKSIEKRKRKRKAPSVSSNNGEVNILRGEKYFNFKNLFYVIFSPFIILFQKPFPKSLRKCS
jgi:hypothetical protein